MGTRFLCCVATWLLGAGLARAAVTQDPRHLVKRRGQEVKMDCKLEGGHLYVYWYQKLPEEGLKFLVYRGEENVLDDSGIPNNRFLTEFPKEGPKVLKIQAAEPGDSAVYFCAGSKSTSMQSHILAVHKRPRALPRSNSSCRRETRAPVTHVRCETLSRWGTEAKKACKCHGASYSVLGNTDTGKMEGCV